MPEGAGDDHSTPAGADGPRRATLGDLITELKRRRVFRALVGYGIFSFAVLQVSEPVLHAYDLPPWILTAVVTALAAGFPIAVILAWLFDLTAEGVKRTPSLAGPWPAPPSRVRIAALLIGVGIIAAVPGAAWYAWKGMAERHAAPATPDPSMSIAVLPFIDMSRQKDQEYLADGIAEEILIALANVDGLRVSGRTSSFWFKGKDAKLAEIGRELRVRSILEGSVRKEGNRVRITAQLLNASDGYHLWSETFDRDLSDIFRIQDEIARAVAAALQVRLAGDATGRGRGRPARIEAYEHYLLGRDYMRRGINETNFRMAADAYEKALALDAAYAPAWAGLSRALLSLGDYGATPAEIAEGGQRALAAAEKAIALDPGLPDGYLARADARKFLAWDLAGAQVDVERALALNPGDASANRERGIVLLSLGRTPEAITALRKAADLDPIAAATWVHLAFAYVALGDMESARSAIDRAREITPDDSWAWFTVGSMALLEGRPVEAATAMERAPEEFWRIAGAALTQHSIGKETAARDALETLTARFGHVAAYQIAQVHAWRGARDASFEWLERAYRQHDPGLAQVKYDPLLRSIRGDPRYDALLVKMKLPAN